MAFLIWFGRVFTKVVVCTRYIPLKKGVILFKDILIKYVPRRAVLNVVSAVQKNLSNTCFLTAMWLACVEHRLHSFWYSDSFRCIWHAWTLAIRLSRNDAIFKNSTSNSSLQVIIFRGTQLTKSWSVLSKEEERLNVMKGCKSLEVTAI